MKEWQDPVMKDIMVKGLCDDEYKILKITSYPNEFILTIKIKRD